MNSTYDRSVRTRLRPVLLHQGESASDLLSFSQMNSERDHHPHHHHHHEHVTSNHNIDPSSNEFSYFDNSDSSICGGASVADSSVVTGRGQQWVMGHHDELLRPPASPRRAISQFSASSSIGGGFNGGNGGGGGHGHGNGGGGHGHGNGGDASSVCTNTSNNSSSTRKNHLYQQKGYPPSPSRVTSRHLHAGNLNRSAPSSGHGGGGMYAGGGGGPAADGSQHWQRGGESFDSPASHRKPPPPVTMSTTGSMSNPMSLLSPIRRKAVPITSSRLADDYLSYEEKIQRKLQEMDQPSSSSAGTRNGITSVASRSHYQQQQQQQPHHHHQYQQQQQHQQQQQNRARSRLQESSEQRRRTSISTDMEQFYQHQQEQQEQYYARQHQQQQQQQQREREREQQQQRDHDREREEQAYRHSSGGSGYSERASAAAAAAAPTASSQSTYTRTMVQVLPGYSVPLRGAMETLQALHDDRVVNVECTACQSFLYCIDSASLVLCPCCRSMSQNPQAHPQRVTESLGLGLTVEHVMDEQQTSY